MRNIEKEKQLFDALEEHNTENLVRLISSKADVNIDIRSKAHPHLKNRHDSILSTVAQDSGSKDIFALLLKAGAHIDEYTKGNADMANNYDTKMMCVMHELFTNRHINDGIAKFRWAKYQNVENAFKYLVNAANTSFMPSDRIRFISTYMMLRVDCDAPILEAMMYAGQYTYIDPHAPEYFEHLKKATAVMTEEEKAVYIKDEARKLVERFNKNHGAKIALPELDVTMGEQIMDF